MAEQKNTGAGQPKGGEDRGAAASAPAKPKRYRLVRKAGVGGDGVQVRKDDVIDEQTYESLPERQRSYFDVVK